jgi:hypothetical protein
MAAGGFPAGVAFMLRFDKRRPNRDERVQSIADRDSTQENRL